MSSQFDDLLADLGDLPGLKVNANTGAANGDDFDPFGPSSNAEPAAPAAATNGGGDSGLLLDFSADSEVKNGDASQGVDLQFSADTSNTSSANPLYDMSATESSNPLYDLSANDTSSGNPLYDLDNNADSQPQQSPNPFYDFEESTTVTTTETSNSNPLYDFEDNFGQQQQQEEEERDQAATATTQEVDLLGGTNDDFGTSQQEESFQEEEEVAVNQQQEFFQQEQEEQQEDVQESPRAPSGQFDDLDYSAGTEENQVVEAEEPVELIQEPEPEPEPEQESFEQQQYEEPATEDSYTREEVIEQDEAVEPSEAAPPSAPPVVEITQAPNEENDGDEFQEQHLPDLVVREEGDDEEETAGAEDSYSSHPVASSGAGVELLTTTDQYGHDRREEDLEQYCMDREESDFVADEVSEDRADAHLKPRAERSRSPSRELLSEGSNETEDIQREDSVTEEESESLDQLRIRGERSHSPSRSMEPQEVPAEDEEKGETQPDIAKSSKTYTSSTRFILFSGSPNGPQSSMAGEGFTTITNASQIEGMSEEEVIQDGRTVSKSSKTENRYSDSGLESKQISSEEYTSNQFDQSNADSRQKEQDIVHFSEMSSVKQQFEQEPAAAPRRQVDIKQEVMQSEGGVYESQPQAFQQWQNEEEEEEGVYESQPVKRDDVAREADRDIGAELPAVGTASSIRAKFLSSQSESTTTRSKREITPPAHGSGGEYVSEPRSVVERYEGKAEAGVFESQPQHNPDVVTSDMVLEEAMPEQGFARNVAARFKELESKGSSYSPSSKREITPDRSGQVEYVSEPRGQVEHYEGKAESGVFESQPVYNPEVIRSGQEVEEQLPERGMAKSLASKFRQISTENTSPPSAGVRGKREITPDTSTRVEYVSEPRGHVETYEPRVEAGVFENQPQEDANVVKSDMLPEDYKPERGFARNVAAKFRELESTAKSPPVSPGRRKEFTPPREETGKTAAGVFESTPEVKAEVVHSGDQLEEALPERGTAKNMAQRFRQLEAENKSPKTSKPKKEFTPPPAESGVFENQPKQFQADYNRPAESGIVENQPQVRDDVVKGSEPPRYEEELPERGMARNLVSRWKQMESESAKASSPGSAGRVKEFTPPREEPRIQQQSRSPRTPMSPPYHGQMDNGSVHPSELPGQYQPVAEASVFESTPERRPDVVREEDTDWTEGMPKKDTAKKMLAKFQRIQSEVQEQEAKQTHTPRKESESESENNHVEPEPSPDSELSQADHEQMEAARLKFEDPDQAQNVRNQ